VNGFKDAKSVSHLTCFCENGVAMVKSTILWIGGGVRKTFNKRFFTRHLMANCWILGVKQRKKESLPEYNSLSIDLHFPDCHTSTSLVAVGEYLTENSPHSLDNITNGMFAYFFLLPDQTVAVSVPAK